jgi:hypothetical protein
VSPAATWPGSAAPGSGWPGSESGGYSSGQGWQGRDWSRRRGGIGAFVTLLAAVASWLLVYDVLLVGWQLPWAGRAGLLVAIFTLIRGLLRRIFRRGRRLSPPIRRRW